MFEYGETRRRDNPRADQLVESSLGIRDYFDAALGTQLLYKFERPQYADLMDNLPDGEKKAMSKHYGSVAFHRENVNE